MIYLELKDYIQFLKLSSIKWENIRPDYVKPLSSFDLSDVDQLKNSSNYFNIQPLAKNDNLIKSDKNHEHDLYLQKRKAYIHV